MVEAIEKHRKRGRAEKRYHHGNLREALLEAAEEILNEGDIASLTLRSAASRAGVSHAAPTHHFGSLKGLLTALGAIGMNRFAEVLEEAYPTEDTGHAYVSFARDNPGLFKLMFDASRLDYSNTTFQGAGQRAGAILSRIASLYVSDDASPEEHEAMRLKLWARAHGYATLMLSGQLWKFNVGDDRMKMLHQVMWDHGEPPRIG